MDNRLDNREQQEMVDVFVLKMQYNKRRRQAPMKQTYPDLKVNYERGEENEGSEG